MHPYYQKYFDEVFEILSFYLIIIILATLKGYSAPVGIIIGYFLTGAYCFRLWYFRDLKWNNQEGSTPLTTFFALTIYMGLWPFPFTGQTYLIQMRIEQETKPD